MHAPGGWDDRRAESGTSMGWSGDPSATAAPRHWSDDAPPALPCYRAMIDLIQRPPKPGIPVLSSAPGFMASAFLRTIVHSRRTTASTMKTPAAAT